MTAEYSCLFGISSSVKGIHSGEAVITHGKDASILLIGGKNDRVFWFLFEKMDKIYDSSEIPRFDDDDAKAFVNRLGDICVKDKPRVTARDLYNTRVSAKLVALEEAEFTRWSYGRLVCVGDSIHKMTPNLGKSTKLI